jgi:outer membrane lipopolysaccharide assembly protein LptE/RlpB|tara:strand:- start:8857 stop:9369 length:513 start_codon:yes stop_codon:yes gene_type:complete
MRGVPKNNLIRFFAIPCLIIVLQSCGYTLRDEISLFSGKKIGVIAEQSSLNRELIGILKKTNFVNRISNIDSVDYDLIINVLDHKVSKYSAAMGSGARVREARIDYFIKLSIKKKDAEEEIYKVESTRFLEYSDSNILSNESEEDQIISNIMGLSLQRIELNANSRGKIK